MTLILSVQARRDLVDLLEYSDKHFGRVQAERYRDGLLATLDNLASFPRMAPVRPELGAEEFRVWPFRVHVLIYRVTDDNIEVVRTLDARRDWQSILG